MLEVNQLVLALVAVFTIAVFYTLRHNGNNKYPPGPKGVPVLGNLFQMSLKPWYEFEKWKEEYGPLVYLNIAGQNTLVLNTHTVASDLFDRRSTVYSDRPRWIVAGEILTRGLFLALAKYGDTWPKLRRAGNEALKKSACIKYHPIEFREAVIMTDTLLKNSKGWDEEFYRQTTSKMTSILYGLPPTKSAQDPLVLKITDFNVRIMHAMSPGTHFVESFPWMLYFPSAIAGWKRRAEEGFTLASDLFVGQFRDVKKRMNEGQDRPCMAGSLLQEQSKHNLNELEASFLCGVMFTGGTFTASALRPFSELESKMSKTVATMSWFLLAMLVYPDKQKKCQEEIDAVVGRSRMPTIEDRDNLPYLKATVREILRWRPTIPTGVPHATTADDWYEGYFIPKGTVCIPNIWSINRDPTVYGPDADDFNPDRFINEKGELIPAIPDTKDGHLSFGFGPRLCIGRHAATNNLFITVACLLWAANISPVIDEKTGQPVLPDKSKTGHPGLVMLPAPFECVFMARFEEVEAIVTQTKEMCV